MRGFRGLQGLPAHTIHSGISFVTTEFAPMTQPRPSRTPGPMKAPDATQLSGSMVIGFIVSGKWG